MTNRLGLAMVVIAVALLVTSSVGVSTVALERSVEIEVVDDDSALVGVDAHEPTVAPDNESAVDLATVTNRAGTAVDVTIPAVDGANLSAEDIDAPASIDSGENGTITATVTCENEGAVRLDVAVSGDGVTIERTVDVTIACDD